MDGMLSLAAYIKIFVAMIVIVNPLGIMPVFVAMTASQNDRQRKTIARIAAITVVATLLISALLGERVLEVFGISLASFKVGGAILILMNSLANELAPDATANVNRRQRLAGSQGEI